MATDPTDLRARLVAALSDAGAYCGDCGFEPGDTGCADCQRVHRMYAKAVLAVVQPLLDRLDFLRSAVDLIRRADISSEQIWPYLKDQRVAIAVIVSDVFAWGGSDAEDITPELLPVLERAWLDCKAIDADEWTAELYAARVRGVRPQGAAYPEEPAIAALFDACGPERPIGLGNPRKPPTATPKEG